MSTTVETIDVEMTLSDEGFKIGIRNADQLVDAFGHTVSRIDDVMDRFERELVRAAHSGNTFGRSMKSIEKSVGRVDRKMHGMTAGLRDWVLIIGQARNALHQIGFLTTAWMGAIVKTNAEIERMTKLLEGMSEGATSIERAAEAQETLTDLFDQAKNAPFTINALTDTFVKFRSVGLDPTDGSMQSLVDAVAAFGGTDETLKRAGIAIQQMGGKGVISMEELRQQLGEAVPQAITLMAQQMGVSYGELVKQISTGTVAAEPALRAMFNGFEMAFGGRAQMMMDTFNGKLAKLQTLWKETLTENEGIQLFQESMKDALDEIIRIMETETFNEFFDNLGNFMGTAVEEGIKLSREIEGLYHDAQGLFELVKEATLGEDNFFADMYWAINKVVEAMDWMDSRIEKKREKANFADDSMFGLYVDPDGLYGRFISALGFEPGKAEITLSDMLGLGEDQDVEEEKLRKRLEAGHNIQADELDRALKLYEDHKAKVAKLRSQVALERQKLATAIGADVGAGGGAGLLTPQQMSNAPAAQDQLRGTINGYQFEIDKVTAKLDDLNRKKMAAAAQGWQGENDRSAFDKQMQALEADLTRLTELRRGAEAELDKITRAFNRTYLESQTVPELEAQRSQMRTQLGAMQYGQGESFDENDPATAALMANLDAVETRLNQLRGIDVSAQLEHAGDEALALADDLRQSEKQLQDAVDEAANMGVAIGKGNVTAAKELAEPWLDQLSDLQSQINISGEEMQQQIEDVMADDAKSKETKLKETSALLDEHFKLASEKLAEFNAKALEKLSGQGAETVLAFRLVKNAIDAMIANVGDNTETQKETLEAGIVTTDPDGNSGSKAAANKLKRTQTRFAEMKRDIEREAEELSAKLMDPFAYDMPDAVQKSRDKLQKMIDALPPGSAAAKDLADQMERIVATTQRVEADKILVDLREGNRSLATSMMSDRDQRKQEYEDNVQSLMNMRDALTEQGMWREDHESALQQKLKLLRQQYQSDGSMGQFINSWRGYFDDLESFGADAFGSLSSLSADFITATEDDMDDFSDRLNKMARQMLNNLLQMSIQAMATASATKLGSMLGFSWAGGGVWSGPVASSNPFATQGYSAANIYHSGGGESGGRKRWISNEMTRGLASNERHAIIEKDEKVFTRDQLKALGGRQGSPDVTTNIINNSGMPMSDAQTNVRMDGKSMILDVVLEAASKPGTFRDSLKQTIK